MIFFDLESVSCADLPRVGSDAYANDPTTRLLSAVWYDSETEEVFYAYNSPYKLDNLWPNGYRDGNITCVDWWEPIGTAEPWVAHNAYGFDSLMWSKHGTAQPKSWIDTLPMARAAGLPGGLDELGKRLLGRGKDEGKRALKVLMTAKQVGQKAIYPVGTKSLWESLIRYNIADVLMLAQIYEKVKEFGEPELIEVDRAINRRGVRFDSRLLRVLSELWIHARSEAVAKVHTLTGGELTSGKFDKKSYSDIERVEKSLSSPVKMKNWLEKQGIVLNNNSLGKVSVQDFLDKPLDYLEDNYESEGIRDERISIVKEVLSLRQTIVSNTQGKIKSLLEIASSTPDCRLRNSLAYHAAHTGRWAGRGLQPHNLAKGDDSYDIQSALDEFQSSGTISPETLGGNPATALSTLFRPVLIPSEGMIFGIADYNAIEARCVAWLADEPKMLETFRSGGSPYLEFGQKMYGRPITKADENEYFFSKTCILGLGYGMGPEKLETTCKNNRVDTQGINYESAVRQYRTTYPAIANFDRELPGLWALYGNAAENVVNGNQGSINIGKCRFVRTNEGLRIYLPSGRPLVYRDARIVQKVPKWALMRGLDVPPRDTVVYTNTHGAEIDLYGGKITENISQAICRDLLANALIRLENFGDIHKPVMHIHDEIICELDTSEILFSMLDDMVKLPEWAEGFPVKVEGHTGPRYTKKPLRGSVKGERNG